MKMLEDRIRKDGIVREGNVLKVDSFINHQMDIPLFREMAREWKRLFAGKPINKVLTIEASGIGIAAVVASELNVPVVFAKKSMSINLDYDNYKTQIQSFTHKKIYNVIVSKKFLTPEDHVLIIDDFLANGCALMGLLELTEKAGAAVEGIGIAIEKGFQPGGDGLRERKLTLAVAESCTGGLLSQKITAVPGASQMFALGICTYTNEMKTAILHVPESTLHTYTAVSPQTAIAMANGVAALSYADLALSVTGYAGPGGGTSEHPVGTVFLGVAYHGTAFAVHLPFDRMGVSTREGVRQGTAVCAFGIAREILMEESVCRNI